MAGTLAATSVAISGGRSTRSSTPAARAAAAMAGESVDTAIRSNRPLARAWSISEKSAAAPLKGARS